MTWAQQIDPPNSHASFLCDIQALSLLACLQLFPTELKPVLQIIKSLPFFFCYFGSDPPQQKKTLIQHIYHMKSNHRVSVELDLTSQSLFLLIKNHILVEGGNFIAGS